MIHCKNLWVLSLGSLLLWSKSSVRKRLRHVHLHHQHLRIPVQLSHQLHHHDPSLLDNQQVHLSASHLPPPSSSRLVRRQIINVRYSLVISFISFILVSIPNAISIMSVYFEEVFPSLLSHPNPRFLRLSVSSPNLPPTSHASIPASTSLSTCH